MTSHHSLPRGHVITWSRGHVRLLEMPIRI